MRVLLVSEPGRDGVFRHVESLARTLSASGVHVGYCYSSNRSCEANIKLAEYLSSTGGMTFDMRVGNAPCIRDIFILVKLAQIILRFKPDIVHAHSSKAGGLCRLIAQILPHIKVVYSPHAYFGMGSSKGLKIAFYSLIETWLANYSVTVNVSDSERQYAIEHLGVDPRILYTIHNGIDLERFPSSTYERKIEARKTLNLDIYSKVICVVARKSFQKNLEFLYEAVSIMKDEDNSTILLHVGEGDMAPEIRKHGLEGHVLRIPYLEDTSIAYAAADCFALTSRYEGFPISVIEALSSGLPVLLSDVKGNSEFLKLGFDAVQSVRLEAPADFARAMRKLIHESSTPFPQHSNRASELFSHKTVLSRMTALYRELESQKAGSPIEVRVRKRVKDTCSEDSRIAQSGENVSGSPRRIEMVTI